MKILLIILILLSPITNTLINIDNKPTKKIRRNLRERRLELKINPGELVVIIAFFFLIFNIEKPYFLFFFAPFIFGMIKNLFGAERKLYRARHLKKEESNFLRYIRDYNPSKKRMNSVRKNLAKFMKKEGINRQFKTVGKMEKGMVRLAKKYVEKMYHQRGLKINKKIKSIAHEIMKHKDKIMKIAESFV